MIELKGKGVSAGAAFGPLRFFRRAERKAVPRIATDEPETELKRYQAASEAAKLQLGDLAEKVRAEAGNDAASLFETHQMMLDDLDFIDTVTKLIHEQRLSAEAAVEDAGKQFAEMFSSMDDAYMKARSADVHDISARLIRILTGTGDPGVPGNGPVIVASDDLTPSETVQLDKNRLLGFVLSGGNSNSHTAILARTLGIPAVICVSGLDRKYEGHPAIIDGQTGRILMEPDEAEKKLYLEKQKQQQEEHRLLNQLKGKPDATLDGKTIRLYANIANPGDLSSVLDCDARGIGLFRSEFLYLGKEDFPSEDQQFAAYKTVLEGMKGKPVIIRTLDIGADKQAGYFHLPKEKNPALGMRAIRICLTRPEIFKTQLRALYRASAFGNLSIMFPMITSVWEVQEIKRICAEVREELTGEKIPYSGRVPLGIMVETPASVMVSDQLAREVDFFSIGTNDLTQYTLAVDRQGVKGLDRFYNPYHPAVLRMIRTTVENAHKAGIWAGICGELGSDPTLLETFLAMGVDELSVTPRAVLSLRNRIRRLDSQKNREKLLAKL